MPPVASSPVDRRRFLLGTAALTGTALASRIVPARAAGPFQIGFVYVGPVGDFGWSYQHDQARKALQEKYGDQVKTNFVENVAEGPDSERVVRQLATSGNELIFATSFGFMNSVLKVAKQFPAVKFEQATGYKTAPNVTEYNGRFYEGRAVCGTIAGHVSKSGVIGYVGSFPIPEVVMGINAFTLAAQKVNPAIKVKVIWVNSWFDPGKEADAAKSLIDQGADILCTHTDSSAIVQTAEARGVHAFGQDSDMKQFGPNAQLSAIVNNWADYYIRRTRAAMDGSWKEQSVWEGLKDGIVQMAPYGPGVDDAARAAAEATKAGIIAGSLHPFAGPVIDNKGQVRIAAGATPGDADLLKQDWYVAGVQA
jgi:simple sugar transport system substrate-binding protein